jgi:hypothetical protein
VAIELRKLFVTPCGARAHRRRWARRASPRCTRGSKAARAPRCAGAGPHAAGLVGGRECCSVPLPWYWRRERSHRTSAATALYGWSEIRAPTTRGRGTDRIRSRKWGQMAGTTAVINRATRIVNTNLIVLGVSYLCKLLVFRMYQGPDAREHRRED